MKGMTLAVLAAAAPAALLHAAPAAAQARVSAGVEYTTGKFGGTESTETLYVPFTLKYDTGRWALRATVPWVHVNGPVNVVGAGEDRIPVSDRDNSGPGGGSGSGGGNDGLPPAPGGERRSESGLGDIQLSAFYAVIEERRAGFGLDLGGKVKLGTADERKGLGTGENDWSVQADLYKGFGELTLFGTGGYRFYGDPPGINLRNVPYASVGASYRMGASTIGVAYDWRAHITTGGDDMSELTAFWTVRMSPQWRLQLYALAGFSDASPDAGVGASLEHRF